MEGLRGVLHPLGVITQGPTLAGAQTSLATAVKDRRAPFKSDLNEQPYVQ